MFFTASAKLEEKLKTTSSNTILAGALGLAFTAAAAAQFMPDGWQQTIAHVGGLTAGSLVLLRQAGMKHADAMKKLNIAKNSAACVQYGLGGNWTGVLINLNSIALNRLYLSVHGKDMPKTFNALGRQWNTSVAIGLGAATLVTSVSAPFLAHAYHQGAETSVKWGLVNAGIQTMPLLANYFGIFAASRPDGKTHRLSMGGAGLTSIGYDVLTQSWGMLLSSVGSVAGTFVGWYKHDRKPENKPA